MSDFSEGKWYVDSAGIVRCYDEYDRSIAYLITSPATKKLDDANARLIVGAPELYRLLVSYWQDEEEFGILNEKRHRKVSDLLYRIDGLED